VNIDFCPDSSYAPSLPFINRSCRQLLRPGGLLNNDQLETVEKGNSSQYLVDF